MRTVAADTQTAGASARTKSLVACVDAVVARAEVVASLTNRF